MTTAFFHKSLSELSRILDAPLVGNDAQYVNISTDTRAICAGDLFIALTGPTFDGNDFVGQAFESGASGAIVSRNFSAETPNVCVENTRLALGRMAHEWRKGFKNPLLAVTGSNGKTTVKELLKSILSTQGHVLATKGNLNNEIGLPLSLLGLSDEFEYGVFELGANHQKEIEYLTAIAKPDVGIVTCAGSAHIEGFGSLDGVANGKGEIFEGLSSGATAVINCDDKYAPKWVESAKSSSGIILGFGVESSDADVRGVDITVEPDCTLFTLNTPRGESQVRMNLLGRHNVMNALAAAAAALAVNISLKNIVRGLESYRPIEGRLNVFTGRRGVTVIDDAYNANPDSMRAAIDVLSAFKGTPVFVIGDMFEIGSEAEKQHEAIGRYAREKGVSALYAVGRLAACAAIGFGQGAHSYESVTALMKALEPSINEDTVVLVKGSHGMHLENVVADLSADEGQIESSGSSFGKGGAG